MAVKIVNPNDHHMQPKDVDKELEYMSKAAHPHVVKILCARWIDSKMEIFMDLQTASLETLIDKCTDSAFLRPLADAVALQILFALHHLEVARGILHRDIKPANILYTIEKGKYIFRLADFGLSKESKDGSATSDLGTDFYKAPEVGNGSEQTSKMDIYSLYMTLLKILDVANCRTSRGVSRFVALKTARGDEYPEVKKYLEMSGTVPEKRASATDMLFKLLPDVYMDSSPAGEPAALDDAPEPQAHSYDDDRTTIYETPRPNELSGEEGDVVEYVEEPRNYSYSERENYKGGNDSTALSAQRPQKRSRETSEGKETVKNARSDGHSGPPRTPINTIETEHREGVESSNTNETSHGRSPSAQRTVSIRPLKRAKMTEKDN